MLHSDDMGALLVEDRLSVQALSIHSIIIFESVQWFSLAVERVFQCNNACLVQGPCAKSHWSFIILWVENSKPTWSLIVVDILKINMYQFMQDFIMLVFGWGICYSMFYVTCHRTYMCWLFAHYMARNLDSTNVSDALMGSPDILLARRFRVEWWDRYMRKYVLPCCRASKLECIIIAFTQFECFISGFIEIYIMRFWGK